MSAAAVSGKVLVNDAAPSPVPVSAPADILADAQPPLTLTGDVDSVEGLKRALLQRCGYHQLAGR